MRDSEAIVGMNVNNAVEYSLRGGWGAADGVVIPEDDPIINLYQKWRD